MGLYEHPLLFSLLLAFYRQLIHTHTRNSQLSLCVGLYEHPLLFLLLLALYKQPIDQTWIDTRNSHLSLCVGLFKDQPILSLLKPPPLAIREGAYVGLNPLFITPLLCIRVCVCVYVCMCVCMCVCVYMHKGYYILQTVRISSIVDCLLVHVWNMPTNRNNYMPVGVCMCVGDNTNHAQFHHACIPTLVSACVQHAHEQQSYMRVGVCAHIQIMRASSMHAVPCV